MSQGVGPVNPGVLVHFELGMWFSFNPNGRSQGQVGHSESDKLGEKFVASANVDWSQAAISPKRCAPEGINADC